MLKDLETKLNGSLHYDKLSKILYATDASVYRELPTAVAFPKNTDDIIELLSFAKEKKLDIIPRAAGTSLAGQCVGNGIVVDISKHFTEIIRLDVTKKQITVQPGVIRDDLNRLLEDKNLFFGPNTSTSNRCMLGGMFGNNSSGTTSIKYGVTRDKIIAAKAVLSDGSIVTFEEIDKEDFLAKTELNTLEGAIYRDIYQLLKNKENQKLIENNFPKPQIHRRNTGYALDALLESEVFSNLPQKFNMCKLLAGSEGTLAFVTEITLQLDKLPPKNTALIAAHFSSITDCLKAVEPVMQHSLYTCEMMDEVILDCTKNHIKFKESRFFLEDDPQAILMLEVRDSSEKDLQVQIDNLLQLLKNKTKSYAQPILRGEEIDKAINLRKAGLGLLSNMQGDAKAVACIEDTAVSLEDLATYIEEFTQIMKGFNQRAVYYAHAGAGELHLRPILNLKNKEQVKLFEEITAAVAELVKKYKGSLSGEHGDGRVRASFIKEMLGEDCYNLLRRVKNSFDPDNILNPGKIVNPLPMTENLRYEANRTEPQIKTLFNFEDTNGLLRAVENCNGSGDCRKSVEAGGVMCPSYRATKNEKDTTRGRANALREFLTQNPQDKKFDNKELKEVLDLCISCKGCKSECPSNVDMAVYKAEFEYQYQKENGFSFRNKLFAKNNSYNKLGSNFPLLTNFFFSNKLTSSLLKKIAKIAPKRSLPLLARRSLWKLLGQNKINLKPVNKIKSVYFFIDEFTNFLDTTIGVDAINLLVNLGYEVKILNHKESGRSYISKGFLEEAKALANSNISIFSKIISEESPLIGLEPSSILSFRDEYLRLANNKDTAVKLSKNVFLIEEFLAAEIKAGNIKSDQFTTQNKTIKLHTHCHQKALSNSKHSFDMLNLPKNYKVRIINSGCCGMAGSFGYEKEHYKISMQIGEHSLFPAVRKAPPEVVISANGTSCRHQILDGTQKKALHPVSILNEALL